MTQKSEILNYLKKNKSINQLVAFNEFRCFRLAPRILELRDDGHNIETVFITDPKTKKTYAEYKLEKKKWKI